MFNATTSLGLPMSRSA